MKKLLSLAAISVIALAGCAGNDAAPSSDDSTISASASTSNQTYKDVKDWSATDSQGTKFTLTQGVQAPSGVEEARKYMGKEQNPLNYVAITVDNRSGSAETSAFSAAFTDPDGKIVEYKMISDFLETSDSSASPSVDVENRIIDVHNAFSGEEYKVAAGEKKTVVLASEQEYPNQITHATINDSTSLSPTEDKAETDAITGAPTPTEAVGSNDTLAKLTGTTLKGNDIRFYIFSPNFQKELNSQLPSQLNGSWGALCCVGATEDQLNETGALTSTSGKDYLWRS